MLEIAFKLTGDSGLLMHNNRLANPLDKYTQLIKTKSGKRKKTIEDIMELARIEWEGGLYLHDGEVKIPARAINKCFERGATKQKNGMRWKTGCMMDRDYYAVEYPNKIKIQESKEIPNPALDKFYEANNFQMMVRVGTASLLRTRPLIEKWSITVGILFDGATMDRDGLVQAAKDAGRLVGLCEWRPEKGGQFGRFSVETVE